MTRPENVGVLLLSHGARAQAANDELVTMAARLSVGMPVAKAFMENAPERSIQHGLSELEELGVNTIVVVPLYFPSADGHMQKVRYELGLSICPPEGSHGQLERVQTRARILLASSFGVHPTIAQIVMERAREVSLDPRQESVVLVAHGSGGEEASEWDDIVRELIREFERWLPFRSVVSATIHPETVRETVKRLVETDRVIVVPLYLSQNMFTAKIIPNLLTGIPCLYSGRPLLPDQRVEEYVRSRVSETLAVMGEVNR